MGPLQHYALRWTPAHPEKRNSIPSSWSRVDCLNHIAVRVSSEQVEIDCRYDFVQIKADDIIHALATPHSCTLRIKDGSMTTLAGIQYQIDCWRLAAYLQERDE